MIRQEPVSYPDVQPERIEKRQKMRLDADPRSVLDKVAGPVMYLPEGKNHLSEVVGVADREEIDQVEEDLLGIHLGRSGLEAGRSLEVGGILAAVADLEEVIAEEVHDFAEV